MRARPAKPLWQVMQPKRVMRKPIDTAPKPGEAGASKPAADAASIKVERTATGAKLFRITEGLVVEGQMQNRRHLRVTAGRHPLRLLRTGQELLAENWRRGKGSAILGFDDDRSSRRIC